MEQLRPVSQLEKILFPLVILLVTALFLPAAMPLIGMLTFGNLLRECGVVERLNKTAQNELINLVTIFLGLAVGSKLQADTFLNVQTLGILALGAFAFSVGTASGVIMGKIMYRMTGGKVNPLIGAAGVSAVPMAARVVNQVGLASKPQQLPVDARHGPERGRRHRVGSGCRSAAGTAGRWRLSRACAINSAPFATTAVSS